MQHELKVLPEYFKAIVDETKTFEVRKNDRNFSAGDTLVLHEYEPRILNKETGNFYTGNMCEVEVCYFLDNFPGIQDGYCVMGIKLLTKY